MVKVVKIENNIVKVEGKSNYKQNQYFQLGEDVGGFVISATKNEANLLVIGDASQIKVQGTIKSATNTIDNVELYSTFFGNIITPFGEIVSKVDNEKKVKKEKLGSRYIFSEPPSLLDRTQVKKSLSTGLLVIDSMIPIGKGQRELIIGDRNSGKTTLALSAMVNKSNKVKNIYVCIGQKRSAVKNVFNALRKQKVLENTIIIFANPDSVAEKFLAPNIAMTLAEIIAYQGEDVLIVFDDLSKHANAYREISLLINKTPGREAFPTDMFFQHSKVLERAGQFNQKYKNGSITALPIVETVQNDLASLIPSNLISITDGQIFTSKEKFNNSEFPAINIGLSVSRTGSSVQNEVLKFASKNLRSKYLELYEIKKFADMSIEVSSNLHKHFLKFNAFKTINYQFGFNLYSSEQIFVLARMFWQDLLIKVKDSNDFVLAFQNYCKSDKGAEKILEIIKKGSYKDNLKYLDKGIKAVFKPLAQAASHDYSGIVSLKEYQKLVERND